MKKARQFDFTPTIAGDFRQPRSSSTHNCCTTGMTRTTTSVSTAQLLIFLLGLLAASLARANIFVSASSCKQGANEGISKLDTLRLSFFSLKCKVLSRVLLHSHRATPDLNLLLFLSWHIFFPGNTAVGKIMK